MSKPWVEVTAILGAVNVVATYFAFRWIDKVGRRPLAIFGYLGMTVFILVAAAGVAFAIGVGGTGWLIQAKSSRPRSGCFAVLCVLAIGFVCRFLPETKGLSVEQAVHVFEREAEGESMPVG